MKKHWKIQKLRKQKYDYFPANVKRRKSSFDFSMLFGYSFLDLRHKSATDMSTSHFANKRVHINSYLCMHNESLPLTPPAISIKDLIVLLSESFRARTHRYSWFFSLLSFGSGNPFGWRGAPNNLLVFKKRTKFIRSTFHNGCSSLLSSCGLHCCCIADAIVDTKGSWMLKPFFDHTHTIYIFASMCERV